MSEMVIAPIRQQLAAPKIGKDAAKASHRIHQDFFEPITRESLTQLLDLGGITVTHFYIEEQMEKTVFASGLSASI